METIKQKIMTSTEIEKIKTAFYSECTERENGLPKINISPHNLFSWFMSQYMDCENTRNEDRDQLNLF